MHICIIWYLHIIPLWKVMKSGCRQLWPKKRHFFFFVKASIYLQNQHALVLNKNFVWSDYDCSFRAFSYLKNLIKRKLSNLAVGLFDFDVINVVMVMASTFFYTQHGLIMLINFAGHELLLWVSCFFPIEEALGKAHAFFMILKFAEQNYNYFFHVFFLHFRKLGTKIYKN